jgi:hypothetical protein
VTVYRVIRLKTMALRSTPAFSDGGANQALIRLSFSPHVLISGVRVAIAAA